MAHENLLWLVKNGGRVLGPLSTEQVGELLKSREISLLDEVSCPLHRWQTIQYHSDFRDVVESMRKASLSERTEATWTPTNATNLTQTITDIGGELTEEISDPSRFTVTAKEIVVNDVVEQKSPAAQVSSARFRPVTQSTVADKNVETTATWMWVVTALVLMGAAAYVVHQRMQSGASKTSPVVSAANLRQSVVSQVQVGNYNGALKLLKEQIKNPDEAGELAIYYGSLLIQVEEQTVLGRRVLEKLVGSGRPEAKQAQTSIGVGDLIDGQLGVAQENFERALAVDSEYVPAVVNLANVYFEKGDYAQAKALALRALRISPLQSEAVMVLAQAEARTPKSAKTGEELSRTMQVVRDFNSKQWDFRAEIGLLELYLEHLSGNTVLESKVRQWLDVDPRLTQDHRHNVFIYRGQMRWKELGRLCERLTQKLGDGAWVAALAGACYSYEGRADLARQWMEKALHQAPKDPLIQAWYAHVLEGGEASVMLGRALEANRRGEYGLPNLLQARFCQEAKDVQCARDQWRAVYGRNMENPSALAGLAWVSAQTKSNPEAVQFIKKGLVGSPDYIPLLELRSRGETEGWYAQP